MSNKSIADLRNEVMAKGFASGKPAYIASARGAVLTDVEGNEYIDFGGGIAVMNVGHSNPKVVAAIKKQAEKFTHTCFMVTPYEQAVLLGEKLCRITPVPAPKRVFLTNAGAEAVENAVKVARYYTKRPAIVVLDHAFHGRTLLTMTMTAKVKPYKWGFGPFAPEVYRIPNAYCYRCAFGLKYPKCGIACAEYIKDEFFGRVTPDSIAAIVAEPVQGEGGFITPPPEYFPRVAQICKENGILFVADEIQSGMARTGKQMFAIEHWGVQPDLITVAKSLGAGMPIAALVGRQEIMDSVHGGGIGGTYGGNPVSCAAANAVLDVYEEQNMLKKSERLGRKVRKAFEGLKKKYEIIGDVRGLGPMLALELVKDRRTKKPAPDETAAVVKYAWEKGLVLLSCGSYSNVIRTMMPLVITDAQLKKGIAILDEAFASLRK
ncbi:MAG TPA: 4-aminobutyrate--2-oxoglutarate transaminase [Deltaproteobacteria bacterium]|jgi:4-aminobutyrate aminotransferase/(S)-3-amino-2-methylpropionate transaminase|nr:4-aminobutyrate--2-oxoglutarate transaminase [Deltaproteobacteria bacterium]HOI08326.1 4-aminobutyrate--2-oxoglutarate transaminase [Deltaproteobacteria bacterium]